MSSVTEVKPPRHLVGLTDPGIVAGHWLSAADNNATLVKAAPAQLFGIIVVNTTATDYFLKVYDKVSAPAPASDTGRIILSIPVRGDDKAEVIIPQGVATSAGLGFALVGGIADNDNTAAATGVAINLLYK